MIYNIDSDYFYSFLREYTKNERKWESKFGQKQDKKKMTYIDIVNGVSS
tara:strand:- start:296 stop:442 length:147 start_codon:yes stop_codon:yes gene_type:complete